LSIARAVERAHRGLRLAARRFDRSTEEHQLCVLVATGQHPLPGVLRVVEDERHELYALFLLRRRLDRSRIRLLVAGQLPKRTDPGKEVLPGQHAQHPEHEPAAEPDADSRARHADAATIFDVLAPSARDPAHRAASQVTPKRRPSASTLAASASPWGT